MKEKKQKKYIGKFFFAFSCIIFLCLAASTVLAVDLEVEYPAIYNQTLESGANVRLPDYVLYLFNAGVFLGFFAVFISLTMAGVMYFLSPAKPDMLSQAKDRISGAISGLLILALTYLIITTINPQLSILHFEELEPLPEPPAEEKDPGVYLYKNSGCSDERIPTNTSSISDLGKDLRNQVNSIEIKQGSNFSFITILYDNTELWGKCKYVNPNARGCQSLASFANKAASVSIHNYNFRPDDDGVYFFRKACFNKIENPLLTPTALVNYCKSQGGGWYKIKNSEIKGIFSGPKANLNNLCFTGDSSGQNACNNLGACTVPEEEQDCVKYDNSGKCTQRKCPTLAGQNISSVIINGDYLVVFFYFRLGTDEAMAWSSCQEFPIKNDVNKLGPFQMKWQNIRNSDVVIPGGPGGVPASSRLGVVPNYVVIIPIQD